MTEKQGGPINCIIDITPHICHWMRSKKDILDSFQWEMWKYIDKKDYAYTLNLYTCSCLVVQQTSHLNFSLTLFVFSYLFIYLFMHVFIFLFCSSNLMSEQKFSNNKLHYP